MKPNKKVLTAEKYYNDSIEEFNKNNFQVAIELINQSLKIFPDQVDYLIILGLSHYALNHLKLAQSSFLKALSIDKTNAGIYFNLGLVSFAEKKYDDACIYFSQSTQLQADFPESCFYLARSYKMLKKTDQAIHYYQKTISIKPDFSHAYLNLAILYHDIDENQLALDYCVKAAEIDPRSKTIRYNYANLLKKYGFIEKAIHEYQMAISIDQHFYEAYYNLSNCFLARAQLFEAIDCCRRVTQLKPDFLDGYHSYLFFLNYCHNYSQKDIYYEHLDWVSTLSIPPKKNLYRQTLKKDRQLKIGYFSPDLKIHPLPSFLISILKHHCQKNFSIYCYANVKKQDKKTFYIQSLVPHWRDCYQWEDDTLFDQVQTDEIDILVDLAGHTANNRLPVFAMKPAPIQVTYLGYPNTTGLKTIDYRLTDRWADPPGEDDVYYSEQLIRLPHCFLCYSPSDEAPLESAPPVISRGYITFGSFNNSKKLSYPTVATWSLLLKSSPKSRLVLKDQAFQFKEIVNRWKNIFKQYGISSHRLTFIGPDKSFTDHLATYAELDIALDTFPYNGTTTTCEALWMGVPVITLSGNRHASRVGASLLNVLGLSDLVTYSIDAYIECILALSRDIELLCCLRRNLRQLMKDSPLCDAIGFTRQLEKEYRTMWHQWCDKQKN